MKFRTAILALALFGASNAFATPLYYTDSQGREWLDLTMARGKTWYQVASVCSATDGICNGVLPDTGGRDPVLYDLDLDGFVWASRDDVRDLIYDAAGLPAGSLDDYEATFPRTLGYGEEFFDNMPSLFANEVNALSLAFTRSVEYSPTTDTLAAYAALVGGPAPNSPPIFDATSTDTFSIAPRVLLDAHDDTISTFFYRPAVRSVPEPATMTLIAAGIFLLIARRRLASARSGFGR